MLLIGLHQRSRLRNHKGFILAQAEMEKAYSSNIEPLSEKEISEQLKTYEIKITLSWNNNRYELRSLKLQTGEDER